MNPKIVLIDGHSILNRAFYGLPDLTNSEGRHTGAVYGFINIMLKILDEEHPDALTVAFDVHKPTFRHDMYGEYKGTRKKMPDELREQVPLIQELLEKMNITVVKKEGYEADDILGTIATLAEREGYEVSLVSGDRDLLQLATEKILIRIPKTKRGGTEIENYHTKDVIEKYGITPGQIIDLKGLMGDSADNIPGVRGVGEKTAVRLLGLYDSVEGVYENIDEVKPVRIKGLLEDDRENAFLSKKLATIKTDLDLNEYDIKKAEIRDIFTNEAYELMSRLGLKSILKRFEQDDARESRLYFENLIFAEDRKAVEDFKKSFLAAHPEAMGISYAGAEWMSTGAVKKKKTPKKTGQLSLFFDSDRTAFVEPVDETEEYYFDAISISFDETVLVAMAGKELTGEYLLDVAHELMDEVGEVIVFNWKNMLHLTMPVEEYEKGKDSPEQKGFLKKNIKDASLAAYLLNPLKGTYEVEDLAGDYLNMVLPVLSKTPDKLTDENMLSYLGCQSYIPLKAWFVMKEMLKEQEMYELFEDIEMPTAYELFTLERLGVCANTDTLKKMSVMLEKRICELETDIYDLAGEDFNINSPKQLGRILFEKMKLPCIKKTKTGYSTAADVLEKLRGEDPIIDKILEYRQVSKLKSTYADGLPIFVEKDGRIHGRFNQTVTATGRISSTDPNLQNIPVRMEIGRQFRKVFEPDEGYTFLDADYSQIELRLLAHMSGDSHMIQAFKDGKDIHKSTASKVFHTPYDEVDEFQRRSAKAVNFGIVYGISAFGLSRDLNISRKEAQTIIDDYFESFPEIKSFLDELKASAKDKGYAKTLFGRRRPVPELFSSNHMQKQLGERIAMNSPIQGTAADIMKIAVIRVAERLRRENLKSRIVLQVHDELLVETIPDEEKKVKEILIEEMTGAADLKVELEVSVESGENWYQAH